MEAVCARGWDTGCPRVARLGRASASPPRNPAPFPTKRDNFNLGRDRAKWGEGWGVGKERPAFLGRALGEWYMGLFRLGL